MSTPSKVLQMFIVQHINFEIVKDKVQAQGNTFPIKENLKLLGFAWNGDSKIWEIPMDKLQENDLGSTYIGTFQPIEATKAQLLQEIKNIKNPFLHQLLENLLVVGEYKESFFTAPGAKSHHHAYAGGLAEHTLQVLQGSKGMADVYEYVNIDTEILITGAILHDIGKVRCYATTSEGIITTKEIELFDHIVLGISIVSRVGDSLVKSPEDDRLLHQLVHIITSHHCLPEWGSPKEPQTNEAWIIHTQDQVSSKIGGQTKLKLS
jgi:putative nucleotidyltransferase with HDIG domain